MLVSELIVEGIAVIEIDRPPVNALAQAVRIPLLAAIRAMDADPAARAILIHGAGRHFIAGSDLREFDAPALEPLLNDVLLRLEACGKPVVAALHGATLGGGFELALACHYRTCTEDLSIGLPEITYGLLPGAGGTQRLPRLIDPVAALDLRLSGKPIGAARALELGVVDAIIDGPVLAAALRYTMQLLDQGAGPRPLRERSIEASLQLESDCRARAARAIADLPGLDAPEFIFECVQAAFHRPFDEALVLSRRRFEQCRVSVASRALRHLFFAERQRLPVAAGSSAPAPWARGLRSISRRPDSRSRSSIRSRRRWPREQNGSALRSRHRLRKDGSAPTRAQRRFDGYPRPAKSPPPRARTS